MDTFTGGTVSGGVETFTGGVDTLTGGTVTCGVLTLTGGVTTFTGGTLTGGVDGLTGGVEIFTGGVEIFTGDTVTCGVLTLTGGTVTGGGEALAGGTARGTSIVPVEVAGEGEGVERKVCVEVPAGALTCDGRAGRACRQDAFRSDLREAGGSAGPFDADAWFDGSALPRVELRSATPRWPPSDPAEVDGELVGVEPWPVSWSNSQTLAEAALQRAGDLVRDELEAKAASAASPSAAR